MTSHILIWKSASAIAPPHGASGLLGWVEYNSLGSGKPLQKFNSIGQAAQLAAVATAEAISRGTNVSIGWGLSDPAKVPVEEMESILRQLQPQTIICPERPRRVDRWAVATSGTGMPESLPAAGIQQALSNIVAARFPKWMHGISWGATALILRHDVSAEELGLIEPKKRTPDDVVQLVAMDDDVLEANRNADPSVPGTLAALVGARLAAQGRAGVAPEQQAPLYSADVEGYLIPVVMRLGRGDAPGAVMWLRRDLRRLYGEHGETILQFMLRTYDHHDIEELRAAARASPASVAA
jgi:hypothetical protein